jgi:hypothetical protein
MRCEGGGAFKLPGRKGDKGSLNVKDKKRKG